MRTHRLLHEKVEGRGGDGFDSGRDGLSTTAGVDKSNNDGIGVLVAKVHRKHMLPALVDRVRKVPTSGLSNDRR